MDILVINGPNLNLLGEREPQIYGTTTLEDINVYVGKVAANMDMNCEFFQSNHEGEIIDKLHEARKTKKAVILNAAAYTHYSYAIRDAIAAIQIPVIEVHLSNVNSRDDFRKNSVIAPVCKGTIAGFGADSYILALYSIELMN